MDETRRRRSGPDLPAMMAENHKAFLAFLRAGVGSEDVAEDLLQAAYEKGLARAYSLRKEEKLIAWFYRLLRNLLVDHYRRQGAEARALERYAVDPTVEGHSDPELERAACACVGQVVKSLKPEYAEILEKVELEGKRLTELAKRSGAVSPGTLAVRLHRARRTARRRLLETCGICAEHGCVDCTCRGV